MSEGRSSQSLVQNDQKNSQALTEDVDQVYIRLLGHSLLFFLTLSAGV